MTKKELINSIANKYQNFPISIVEKAINIFFKTISNALINGEHVELRGLGSFFTKKRRKKISKNPKTGAILQIAEKTVPAFKQSRSLAKSLIITPSSYKKKEEFTVIYKDFTAMNKR